MKVNYTGRLIDGRILIRPLGPLDIKVGLVIAGQRVHKDQTLHSTGSYGDAEFRRTPR